MATNGQVEVDDDSSASVKAEPGSEDKPGPTEGDDVDAGAEGLATLVVLVLDALDSGLAGTGPGCSHNRGLLEKGGLGLPWSRAADGVPRLPRVTPVDLHLVDT